MEDIGELFEFSTALERHYEHHQPRWLSAGITKGVRPQPHGQSASAATSQPHIVPCDSKFICSWHSYQPRWLKHGMCNGWDTFRENQASGERVLDQPTHTVYSSMLMLMRHTKSFIINVNSAIHSTHLQASPSSRLESSMSSLSMYCCHWGPGGGGGRTACHLVLVLVLDDSKYLLPLSVWPSSCSVLVM